MAKTKTEDEVVDVEDAEVEDVTDEPTPAEIEEGGPALPPAVRETAAEIEHERATYQPARSSLPSPMEWEATLSVARQIAATPFVPESYRGQPESVVAAILTGRELGIGPMQALREIHMIDGRATFSATLMLAKMRQGGVVILDSGVDDDRAWIKARRADTGEEAEVEWRYEEATKILRKGKPLSDGANWKNYRQDMLWARCVGRLARRLGSDLLGGLVYAAEEVREWDEGTGYAAADDGTGAYFDPGRDLMPKAIRGPDSAARLHEVMQNIDPGLDWGSIVSEAAMAKFGRPRAELDKDETAEFWRRLSNTVCWIQEEAGSGDFPPIEQAVIAAGFVFGFGAELALPLPLAVEEEPDGAAEAMAGLSDHDAEIPFGEDEPKEDG